VETGQVPSEEGREWEEVWVEAEGAEGWAAIARAQVRAELVFVRVAVKE
jgi:hypothetical protein